MSDIAINVEDNNKIVWNFRQNVTQKTLKNLDGAPPDYWQVYADDKPPYNFPLPSPWVTKGVIPPDPVRHELNTHIWNFVYPLLLFIVAGAVLHSSFLIIFGGVISLSFFYKFCKFLVGVVAPPTPNEN